MQIGKEEINVSLFADHMILYLKDPENSIRKSLGQIMISAKLQSIKFSKQISISFLNANKVPTKKEFSGSDEMVYCRKPLVARSDDPCLITETHIQKKRTDSCNTFSVLHNSTVCLNKQMLKSKKKSWGKYSQLLQKQNKLGINILKTVKDFYNNIFKTLKETEDGKTSHVCLLAELICENGYITEHVLQIQCTLHENSNNILYR